MRILGLQQVCIQYDVNFKKFNRPGISAMYLAHTSYAVELNNFFKFQDLIDKNCVPLEKYVINPESQSS